MAAAPPTRHSEPSARRLFGLTRALSPAATPQSTLCTAAAGADADALTIAFIGFRHGHIGAVHQAASESPSLRIVGVCEEHAATREELAPQYAFTHTVRLSGLRQQLPRPPPP